MSNFGYVNLSRQSGLLREMQTVANNIANLSTTGYRREGVVFAEYIQETGPANASLSIADANGRLTDPGQGALEPTGGSFDFAIEGDGFFLLETPNGPRLTRNGAFTRNSEGEIVSSGGYFLLDTGGSPIFAPPDARNIALARDGTLSADGEPLAQVAVVLPENPRRMIRESGVMFTAPGGHRPVENVALFQGYLEKSNVDPIHEVSRMIEIQRGYELGQKFLDREDDRIRTVIRTLGQ